MCFANSSPKACVTSSFYCSALESFDGEDGAPPGAVELAALTALPELPLKDLANLVSLPVDMTVPVNDIAAHNATRTIDQLTGKLPSIKSGGCAAEPCESVCRYCSIAKSSKKAPAISAIAAEIITSKMIFLRRVTASSCIPALYARTRVPRLCRCYPN